jgi:hypothetical protein
MRQRGGMQFLPVLPPMGQVLFQNGNEAVVMIPLKEMHPLVGDDVFQAGPRLLGQTPMVKR